MRNNVFELNDAVSVSKMDDTATVDINNNIIKNAKSGISVTNWLLDGGAEDGYGWTDNADLTFAGSITVTNNEMTIIGTGEKDYPIFIGAENDSQASVGGALNVTGNTNNGEPVDAVIGQKTDDVVEFYTVTVQDGADILDKATVNKNGSYELPIAPTKEGYELEGWRSSADNKLYTGTVTITADTVFTAQWDKISSGGASHPEAGSSSSSSDRYEISKPSDVENGSIKVSDSKAEKGDTVTITVTPDEGYELDELVVYDEDGDEIDLKDKGDGKFTFEMPKGDVEIEVSFAAISGETPKADFVDVPVDAWYAEAVQYVYENGMMSGTSETTFSPDLTTTRGMIVTILYRLENEPTVTGTTAFTDVAADQYYANAVAWAAQNGIVSGIDATTFAPNNAITREQMAAILYRYAQFKGYDVSAKADLSVYTDAAQVSTYATDAMAWANGAQLITGISQTTLTPAGNATRAQVATILMRFCENIAK